MKRARTVDEYVALIKDAIYEVEDMRAAIEYDEEFMADSSKIIDELESSLKEVLDAMQNGTYNWRTGDLKYIPIIKDLDERVVPFRALLLRINDTHKHGLEPEDSDSD